VETLQDTLSVASLWVKEWQPLIAGLLVVLAALILARATVKAAQINAAATRSRPDARDRSLPDLRQSARPPSTPAVSSELLGALEQLRSMVRSALASLTLTSEKENGPAYFLCQRIAHLRLERFALPPGTTKAAHELCATLSEQLESLRLSLAKNASADEVAQILVQLNASARNLTSTLLPAPLKRQQAASDAR
jgi:hypothetical protein